MDRTRTLVLLAAGGCIYGGLLGVFSGAFVGALYGLIRGDISLGLDGALLGGLILAVTGISYGIWVGIAAQSQESPPQKSIEQSRDAHEELHVHPVHSPHG